MVRGFDVNVIATIGRVEIDPEGTERAGVAAFKMIAEHAFDNPTTQGTADYSFPSADGETCHVTVRFEQ